MERIYDLVVVGAGFAGLRCAKTAALRGLKVLVIDQKSRAGARVRTTGILVKEAAEEMDFPAHLSRKIPGVRLYAPSGTSINLTSPGYVFHATDTPALLDWMAEETSRAGAEVSFGHAFRGAVEISGGYELSGLNIKTRYLVGADGAKSRVATSLELSRNRHFLHGVELGIAYEDANVDPHFLHCFLTRRVAPGYLAWAVPGPKHIQIGLAAKAGAKPSIEEATQLVREVLGITRIVPVDRRAGVIPCSGRLPRIGNPRALLIGDAAGMVSPLTAGGIQPALHFGRQAGQAIAAYLQDGGPSPAALLACAAPRYGLKRLQRIAMDVGIPDFVWDVAIGTRTMRSLAQWLYFHRRAPGPRLERQELDWVAARYSADAGA